MGIISTVIDFLANQDVIDLYFILSDLYDFPLEDSEIYETAEFDAYAMDEKSFFDRLTLANANIFKGTFRLANGIVGRMVHGVFRQTEPQELENGLISTPSHLLHKAYLNHEKYDYKD